MDYSTHNKLISFIWQVADDFLRDVYVRGKYRDVILPFTVLTRLDSLLEPTKTQVLKTKQFLNEHKMLGENRLKKDSGYTFFNTSSFTLKDLLDQPSKIKQNFEYYLDGYSNNVQEIIDKFKLRNQLDTMQEANILYGVIEKFVKEINLSPKPVLNKDGEIIHEGLTNLGMGYVFEELIRKFNEENNEEAGEHFTPREVIQLMTHIVFLPAKDYLTEGTHLIYDPACGSGGMLTEAERFIHDPDSIIHSSAEIYFYGQEINPETYAICKSDILLKEEKPEPENIAFGSTLQQDKFAHLKFDFMLSNPPYGKSWKNDMVHIVGDKGEIIDPRFKIGVPRSSDGQLLFLVAMLSKMKHDAVQGSRIASIHNGSALFTGDAGSGESNIRQWIIENDWLEAIIQLPKNLFYNTGITTYIWLLSNRKAIQRKGKIQLINASDYFEKMRKSLGSKTCQLSAQHITDITALYIDFQDSPVSKIFNNDDFGYYKITVDRPLRLMVHISNEAIENLRFNDKLRDIMRYAYQRYGEVVYTDLLSLKKPLELYLKNEEITLSPTDKKKLFEPLTWQRQVLLMAIAKQLQDKLPQVFTDFNNFQLQIEMTLKTLALRLDNTDKKTFCNAVSYKDENAQPVIKNKTAQGIEYEADSELRDSENVPLIDNIKAYFAREVLPFAPDAWIDNSKTVKGYEINFNRYFYQPKTLRSLDSIRADILALEQETEGLLNTIISD